MGIQKLFVVLFVLANLILPFVIEEVFPITTAPMFRDQPSHYCEFMVVDPNGTQLPLAQFGLQRNYDGNPVGYGSGRLPAESLDRFGSDDSDNVVPHKDEIIEWVGSRLAKTDLAYVIVRVKVWGQVGKQIDVTDSWEIVVPNDPARHADPLDQVGQMNQVEQATVPGESKSDSDRNETAKEVQILNQDSSQTTANGPEGERVTDE